MRVIIGTGFALFFLFAILVWFFSAKYIALIQNRHPKKAREYGFPPDSWGNSGLFLLSLFRDDLQDPDIRMYRVRLRRCLIALVTCLVAMTIGIMVAFLVGA